MRHGNITRSLRTSGCLLAALFLLGSSGCRICCAPFDWDYGYTGGAWVRDNPSCGRVGSAFEPAGYKAIEDEPTEAEPTPAEGEPPAINNLDTEGSPDETAPMPAPAPAPGMISTPRMRPVRNYLPQN